MTHDPDLLSRIGATAESLGCRAYLVGGPVRDAILGKRNYDLDVAIEGDAIAVGHALASASGGRLVAHARFGTCTITFPDGTKADLVTARRERYERPGALPIVTPGSVRDDLARRDFTMNAMARRVGPGAGGVTIDPYRGAVDITSKRLRVLHDRSFLDDPTRIFRAARFSARLGFRVDPLTKSLIVAAARSKMLARLSPVRVRNEVILLLREKNAFVALKNLDVWCGLGCIDPRIVLTRRLAKEFNDMSRYPDAWVRKFASLLSSLPESDREPVCRRLEFTRADRAAILRYAARDTRVT